MKRDKPIIIKAWMLVDVETNKPVVFNGSLMVYLGSDIKPDHLQAFVGKQVCKPIRVEIREGSL